MIGLRLRHASGNSAYAHFGDEFHRNARRWLHVLKIVDQLSEVFDRINVVVRRGRDKAHTRRRVAHRANALVDLVTRQLPAFTRLCALRHLDLDIVGICEILSRHTKAARGDLLDAAAHRVAVFHGLETEWFLAAFTRVRAPANTVHRNREGRVRLMADRAKAHRAGGETLDDFSGWLDLVDVERLIRFLELQEAAD